MAPMKLTPLLLEITVSRWGIAYIGLLHILVLVAVFYFPFSLLYQLIVSLLVFAHCLWCLRGWLFPAGKKPLDALGFADSQWQLYREEELVTVELVQSTVWTWLVVLNFREADSRKKHSLVLWPDSANEQQLRRLRIVLRHLPVYGNGSRDRSGRSVARAENRRG